MLQEIIDVLGGTEHDLVAGICLTPEQKARDRTADSTIICLPTWQYAHHVGNVLTTSQDYIDWVVGEVGWDIYSHSNLKAQQVFDSRSGWEVVRRSDGSPVLEIGEAKQAVASLFVTGAERVRIFRTRQGYRVQW